MQSTLEAMGLGPKVTHWIKALYNQPTAKVKVNGVASGPFEMHNGTRQGCPLSPLLFVLSLEPLLVMIRQNLDFRGITIGEEEHKLAAYADNILFFISNPRITLLNLMKALKTYGELSNFKMNPSKSEILNINIQNQEEQAIQNEFPFIWSRK